MTTFHLTISPFDPIIARDGRPFGIGQGNRMRSLDWLYPSVVAGSLRTMLGSMTGSNFDSATVKSLKEITIAGPLPTRDGRLFFPAPKDILVRTENEMRTPLALRPTLMNFGEGCNLPSGSLMPTMLPESIDEDFKPAKMPAFWSVDKMVEWLINPTGEGFDLPETGSYEVIETPDKDERIHVKIDRDTGASEDGKLFSTMGLDISHLGKKGGIASRIEAKGIFESKLDQIGQTGTFYPLGGERRLSFWSSVNSHLGWDCPSDIPKSLNNSNRIRMVLATPAIFSKGWLPGWLHEENGFLRGGPLGAPDGLSLKLISASIDRWKPISGWSLEKIELNKNPGPKKIHRLVPAGSVYFFEVQKERAADLAQLWLKPVSDDEQDCRDGFGLALWGTWNASFESRMEEKKTGGVGFGN